MKSYLIPSSKPSCLNKSVDNFPNFAFSELIYVAKYGGVTAEFRKTGRNVTQKKYQGKN